MNANIHELLQSTQPKVGTVRFISVDGHGGSGKSTLAKILGEKLNAGVIHIDDFSGLDSTSSWCERIIQEVFQPIAKGSKSLTYQPASWGEGYHPAPITDQPVTDVMILEGVSSSRKEFQEYVSLNIFVETPREVCLNRGVKRDLVPGQSEEEVVSMWEEWFEEEDEYMNRDNPKKKANLILDGTKSFEDQIAFS